jgi:hypothetical protein
MKILKTLAIALPLALTSFSAFAAVDKNVQLNFASGAQFSGVVTFADSFASVLAVNGVLAGYQGSSHSYLGTGSTAINWLWNGGSNFASAANTFGTFLMDTGNLYGGYSNWISFTYDYSNPANLTLSSNSYGNQVNYSDNLVSGSIGAVSPVPEVETYAMLLAGLGLMGGIARRRSQKNAAV